jgi:hypothetical protein
VIDLELAAELDALAEAIARMKPPSNRNPHAFHEDRSELAGKARAIAQRCRTGKVLEQLVAAPAPIGRQAISHTTRHIEGRTVLVLTRRQVAEHPLC